MSKPEIRAIAKTLRKNPTEAEKRLWSKLCAKQLLGLKFRRQAPIDNYIADFACFKIRLVIELDGGQHCDNEKDKERTKFLESIGFKVIRFWNNDVLQNTEGVLMEISQYISTVHPHLNPPPDGEEI